MLKTRKNDIDDFLLHLENIFSASTEDARDIIKAFHEEMRLGLSGMKSSLKMLPSYVGLPNGKEKGRYVVLDLGGTNIRVMTVKLDGTGGISVASARRFVIPQETMRGTGDELFDFLAECVGVFLQEHEMSVQASHPLTFTFSFPVEQHSLVSGILMEWTKNFTASDVVGKDVVSMLSDALRRRGMDFITIAALANDTVGTLLARRYSDVSCDMGVIIGTGTNAAYPERTARIAKYQDSAANGEMIVNIEWGGFSRLKMNRYDLELDRASHFAGVQHLEKMVSGMYLGEIARRVIVDMIIKGLVFRETDVSVFSVEYALRTEHISRMAEGADFFSEFNLKKVSETDKKTITEVCRIVSTRSARIVGAAIAAVVAWMDPVLDRNHTIAIDGALFERYPGYSKRIEDILHELFGKDSEKIKLELVKDGSGIGSAVIGAVASYSLRSGDRLD